MPAGGLTLPFPTAATSGNRAGGLIQRLDLTNDLVYAENFMGMNFPEYRRYYESGLYLCGGQIW